MSELAKCSKEDLIYICERQEKKLKKYEKRFSDLVNAYKELLEEKKILEDSLKAVSQEKKDDGKSLSLLQKSKAFITKNNKPPPQDTSNDVESDTGQAESNESLEAKVELLTKNFQSLSEKKSKMEKDFQADKKGLIAEQDKQATKFEDEIARLTIQNEKLKNQIGHEQKDRTTDEELHSSMLNELQNVLATERLMNDELKAQLAQYKKEETNKEKTENLLKFTAKVENSRKPRSPSPSRSKDRPTMSQDELDKLKKELVAEQTRISQTEILFQLRQTQDEDRIFELEQKISELSVTIGHYEKQRFDDHTTIQKLKHKVDKMIEQATTPTSPVQIPEKVLPNIGERNRSRTMSEEYARFFENDRTMISATSDCSAHEMCNCKQEYRKLKLELEHCKSKLAQKHSKGASASESQMADEHKSEIAAMKQEKKRLIRNYEEKERNFLDSFHKLEKERSSIDEKCKKEIEDIRKNHMKQIGDLQMELQKQRNRSINLISEKDMEIEQLQRAMYDQDGLCSSNRAAILPTKQLNVHSDDLDEFIISPVQRKEEGSLFRFIEQSNIDREMSQLRDQAIDLQEQHCEAEKREEQLLYQMQVLKDEIRKLERSRSRESANLEYLKNICLKYMMTKSVPVKKQMSVALSAILHFSPNEIKEVEKRHAAGWW